VTQITGGLNDTTNASYAQANTARTTANDAYGQANTARDQANTARTQANTAYGQANNAYSSANLAYDQANASYNVANTKLASAGGTLSGDLIITGNLTVSGNSTTLNTEILTVEDAEVVLLSNVASTPALNAGVIVNRGTSANTFLRWDEALDEWGWSDSGTTTYYFDDLRAGLATTNTTFGTINTSLGTINTSYQAAYAQANTAGTNALNAYGQANAAYGAANNRVLKAGDTMTGQLNISSGGLLVTGNVGIGTTTPGNALHVVGSANVTSSVFIGSDGVRLSSDGAGELGVGYGQTATNRKFSVYNNTTLAFTVTPTGNVGIGTASPAYTLDLLSSTSGYVSRFKSSGNYGGILLDAGSSGSVGGGYYGVAKNGTRYGVFAVSGAWIGDTSTDAAVSADSGNIRFFTNGSVTESMRINTSGNVGIGTTNPTARLNVYGAGTANDPCLALDVTSSSTFVHAQESFAPNLTTNQTVLHVIGREGSTKNSGYIGYTYSGTPGSDSNRLTFGHWAADHLMTLTGAGNVGINSSSPSSRLWIQGTGTTSTSNSKNFYASSIFLYDAGNGGTTDSTVGIFGAFAGDGGIPAGIGFARESSSNWGSQIRFYTHKTSTTDINETLERMRIAGDGNVGIGTTNPGYKLHVVGTAYVYDTSGSGITVDTSTQTDNQYLQCKEAGTLRFSIYENSNNVYLNSWTNMVMRVNQTGGSGGHFYISGGDTRPGVDNTYNLGSTDYRWANIYTADLNLSNRDSQNDVDGTWGAWTIQEGENDLYLINRRNGKKFKFMLKEVE
jgi:hypothetical protein